MRGLIVLGALVALVAAAGTSCGGLGGNTPDPLVADGGTDDPGDPHHGEDGGDADGGDGPDDGGADDADAGMPDDPDAGVDPDPIDPACANQQGNAETCHGEWLKEIAPTGFTPVEKGALGAGPWGTGPQEWGGAEGIGTRVIGVSVDTGQNVWAVSREAVFVRRSGAATFERYDRATSGLRDFPFLSVEGGGPGVAFVGYEGVFGADPENEPVEVRKSGDLQRVELTPVGLAVFDYDTHNSNTPLSGKYDHSRNIFRIEIPRRGPAAGEMFLATEHGIVRYQGDLYADHVHIDTVVGGSQRFGPSKALGIAPDGTAWYGNDFKIGGRPWTPRRYEWLNVARWKFPHQACGAAEDRDYWNGIDVDSTGDVWAGSRACGLVRIDVNERGTGAELRHESAPDTNFNDLVVDGSDAVWIGTDGGLFRRDPVSGTWSSVRSGQVNDLFLDDTVSPEALYVATGNGIFIVR